MQISKEKTVLHCATANTMRQARAHQTLHKEVPQWLDSRGCSQGVVAEANKPKKLLVLIVVCTTLSTVCMTVLQNLLACIRILFI